jgi:hypothetical protein
MPDRRFARFEWQHDRVLCDDLVFRLETRANGEWDHGDECFVLHKGELLARQYEAFFATVPHAPASILELGMWEGGSVAYWNLVFAPEVHVGVDLMDRTDSDYFSRFVARTAPRRIWTRWGVDQADRATVLGIVDDDLGGRVDLVIDDASHVYQPTRTSFETVFPRVNPGGLYIIEDWAWVYWAACQRPDHPWLGDPGLSRLTAEILELAGSAPEVVSRITVFQGFVVVERGTAVLADDFRIDDHVVRRPAPPPPHSWTHRATRRARARARHLFHR